jgi:hypothetical protein
VGSRGAGYRRGHGALYDALAAGASTALTAALTGVSVHPVVRLSAKTAQWFPEGREAGQSVRGWCVGCPRQP